MARGSKAKYSSKQKRQAKHIEDSVKKRGGSSKAAGRIAWATVNKETGGAGRAVRNTGPSKKGGKIGSRNVSHAARVAAGKKLHLRAMIVIGCPHAADEAYSCIVPAYVDLAFKGALEGVVDMVRHWGFPCLHACKDSRHFQYRATP